MTGLAAALVAAQKEMPKVEPDAVNPHFKSKFVSLDHLIAKTRPVLNKHGLAIVQSPTHIEGSPALATTLYHSSGESATDVMPLILAGSNMQKLGAALTYARRYAWAAALGIAGEEDDDGEQASAPAKPDRFDGSLQDRFKELAEEYKKVAPKFDVAAAVASTAGKDAAWLTRQVKRLEELIVHKKAEAEAAAKFPIPDSARAA